MFEEIKKEGRGREGGTAKKERSEKGNDKKDKKKEGGKPTLRLGH